MSTELDHCVFRIEIQRASAGMVTLALRVRGKTAWLFTDPITIREGGVIQWFDAPASAETPNTGSAPNGGVNVVAVPRGTFDELLEETCD